MEKITLIGGSGFIGSKLSEALLAKGYSVTVVDMVAPRVQHGDLSFVQCDAMRSEIPASALEGARSVVNLAGATIGKRWTKSYKKLIWDSRIETTRHVAAAFAACAVRPAALVSASAVGYYGDSGSSEVSETAPAGTDYLARLCAEWEKEARAVESSGTRVALIRTANVLGKGGLLATLRPMFERNLGAYFGTGMQCMPWVHVDDIVGIYVHAIEHPLTGPYNTGAGKTLAQKELFAQYSKALGVLRPWRIPAFIARLVLGEFSEALLGGQNTVSKKIAEAGYAHSYTDAASALRNSL